MKEIVIKISDETYNECLSDEDRLNIIWELVDAIRKGTPLPNGHGKLKDINKIYDRIDALNRSEEYKGKYTGVLAILTMADTIIEAGTAESEE